MRDATLAGGVMCGRLPWQVPTNKRQINKLKNP